MGTTVILIVLIFVGTLIFRSILLGIFNGGEMFKALAIAFVILALAACYAASTLQEAYQAGLFK